MQSVAGSLPSRESDSMPQNESHTVALFENEGMDSPISVLKRVYGYPVFRGKQAAVIDRVVSGGDAVVLFPTGAGKSLCFQIPALCRSGVGVVVSPLIALMRDQVEALKQLGRAEFIAVAGRIHRCAPGYRPRRTRSSLRHARAYRDPRLQGNDRQCEDFAVCHR